MGSLHQWLLGVHFSASMQRGGRPTKSIQRDRNWHSLPTKFLTSLPPVTPVLVAQALTGCSWGETQSRISVWPGRGKEEGDADDVPTPLQNRHLKVLQVTELRLQRKTPAPQP